MVGRPSDGSWLYRIADAVLRRVMVRVERIGDHAAHGSLYLTRWVLRENEHGKLMLHYFHRSDYAAALHDHPWSFTSLILWPGYWEHTDCAVSSVDGFRKLYTVAESRTWHGPLSLIRRPAEWRHRVEIIPGRGCWTLVITGSKVRSWGFWCPSGYRPWREFDARQQAGVDGCSE